MKKIIAIVLIFANLCTGTSFSVLAESDIDFTSQNNIQKQIDELFNELNGFALEKNILLSNNKISFEDYNILNSIENNKLNQDNILSSLNINTDVYTANRGGYNDFFGCFEVKRSTLIS